MLTLASIRLSCLCYAAAVWLQLRDRGGGRMQPFRWIWTLGLLFYLVHMVSAFASHHGWSHAAALADTARQTRDAFRVDWGGGLYFNYAFTAVWMADVAWMWLDSPGYGTRSGWVSAAIHGFLAFMFFNGAVVFAHGWFRWAAAAVSAALLLQWLVGRRAASRLH